MSIKIAKEEWRKEKREKSTYYFLLLISVLSAIVLILVISLHVLEITGFATQIASKAGYITKINISSTKDVEIWGGFYGLVLRVPGFTQQLSKNLESGTIERADVFFDCLQHDAEGGPEIYASTNPNINLLSATVQPGTTEMVDEFIDCSGEVFCASETYTQTISIFLGENEITGIPATYTYKADGSSKPFVIGVLNVSGDLVFVSKINATIQPGFNPDNLVNYQMLLPTPANQTQNYYFYTDPNDVCPSGGIGNSIEANIYGYIFNSTGAVENATITVAGYSASSDSSGFYNLTSEVLEGTFNFLVQKEGHNPYLDNVTITFSDYIIEKNATLQKETLSEGEADNTLTPVVFGSVKDTGGNAIAAAEIYLGNGSTTSGIDGLYNFAPLVLVGNQPIVAIKENYDNYYKILTFNSTTTTLNYDIVMSPANLNTFETGPYDEEGEDSESFEQIRQQAEDIGQDYWISATTINKQVRENTFVEEPISIYNFRQSNLQVSFSLTEEISELVKIDRTGMAVSPDTFESATLTISGVKPIGVYTGTLTVSGDIESEIPIRIEIIPKKFPVEMLVMEIDLLKDSINPGSNLRYNLNLQNLLTEQSYVVNLKHSVVDSEGKVHAEYNEEAEIQNFLSLIKEQQLPEEIPEGDYSLKIEASYLGLFSDVSTPFSISRPLYLYSFFGIPLWIILVAISFLSFILFNFFLYQRHVQKKKRYHLALNLDTLPKPGERSVKIGKIAEKETPAYYNIDDFTTHAIVAGATGGGKSIAAQVLVEELLQKNIAVLVFDPTAQWSGMLRKCEDKKMLSFYPKFGLKPNDAKAFPGNVRQIQNERQSVDVRKFVNPGQIQIFTLNKLTPQQIDVFVAGVINNIFKSDPKEYPGLRVMLVFDEVHRLLPKFGGSGKGFLQIERACREFRKWGFGVMLVSQVLSDFVGEIKANINTEVQMRVAEEKDLERIKERYGLDALKSLVRADVGTGMIQNAEYNKGLPYFVSLRPILHNTRRLSDEVLEKYNQYNEQIDDLEYQIEQLEQEKVDTFDLKMELKLVKDKLMTGNFTVVDIYLEGLKPRIEKQWDSLGKKPKKREIELIDVGELESALTEAQKARDKWKKEVQGGDEEETKEAKPEDKGAKIVAPLTFDNGIMVSSLNELQDVLPNFDDSVFKSHVNDEKNDISYWVEKQIDAQFGATIKNIKDKAGMIKAIEDFKKPAEKKEEPKEENKNKEADEKSKQKTEEQKEPSKEKSEKTNTEKESAGKNKSDDRKRL